MKNPYFYLIFGFLGIITSVHSVFTNYVYTYQSGTRQYANFLTIFDNENQWLVLFIVSLVMMGVGIFDFLKLHKNKKE